MKKPLTSPWPTGTPSGSWRIRRSTGTSPPSAMPSSPVAPSCRSSRSEADSRPRSRRPSADPELAGAKREVHPDGEVPTRWVPGRELRCHRPARGRDRGIPGAPASASLRGGAESFAGSGLYDHRGVQGHRSCASHRRGVLCLPLQKVARTVQTGCLVWDTYGIEQTAAKYQGIRLFINGDGRKATPAYLFVMRTACTWPPSAFWRSCYLDESLRRHGLGAEIANYFLC